jgi:hypothetical protein
LYCLCSHLHCAGVNATRLSAGIFPSRIKAIMVMTVGLSESKLTRDYYSFQPRKKRRFIFAMSMAAIQYILRFLKRILLPRKSCCK